MIARSRRTGRKRGKRASPAAVPAIRIFISHSSRDVALAKLVIDLLRGALNLPPNTIRCTSVPGHKLPGGAPTNDQLRREILAAPVFIGLVTEAGLESAYVLFELGARWGRRKRTIPLLAPGVAATSLKGPISDANALSCSLSGDLYQLICDVAEILGEQPNLPSAYDGAIEVITKYPPPDAAYSRSITAVSIPQTAVDTLAELRSEGIHDILNRRVRSDVELDQLADYTHKWCKRVVEVLEKNFTKAEQLNFTRLGTVPLLQFGHAYDGRHAKILREFALQESRLLEIIARHTR